MKSKKNFCVGDKVFAKVKGYPPWPAIIDEIKGKRYSVTFYGTKETSKLKLEDLCDYIDNRDKITGKYSKKKGFLESIRELEEELSGTNTTIDEDIYQDNGRVNSDDVSESFNDDGESQNDETPVAGSQKRKKRSLSVQSGEDLPAAKRQLIDSRKSSTASNASSRKRMDSPENQSQYFDSSLKIDEDHVGNDRISSSETNVNKTVSERDYEIIFADELYEKTNNIFELIEKAKSAGDTPVTEKSREKDLLLIARTPEGEFIGIKYDTDRPKTFENEMARLHWTDGSIRNILKFKSQIEHGEISPNQSTNIVTNPQLTIEERILAIEKCVVRRKQERLHWLQLESKLVEYDSEIKSYLGLERADTEKALHCLEEILALPIEQLMLTKHPHVVDMVRRLRRYIGNIKAWDLSDEQAIEFSRGAEQIRQKADEVYQKFKTLYETEHDKSFSDIYNNHVKEFNMKTKNMKEAQRFAVCAKPGTRQFEMDQMDDQLEIEAIKLKNELENKKVNPDSILSDTNSDVNPENS
ncbi:PC4 and SFRS1-interacting protein isoform X2 [Chrysoperla carnea]|uniref:PC4 and SFRS1-interacting protein isoform X2 n=1 Tax=Chrysoperla carnea TaxID=189513 RepID=UPI001D09239C|nr:PC4 and SFRS1-interacting protein isoform X2 [Chrysoperla carnea]